MQEIISNQNLILIWNVLEKGKECQRCWKLKYFQWKEGNSNMIEQSSGKVLGRNSAC